MRNKRPLKLDPAAVKRWGKIFSLALLIAAIMVAPIYIKKVFFHTVKSQLAVDTIKALYEFGDEDQLEANQSLLKHYVTEDVYNQLTYDNDQRRLNTYLKFSQEATTVNIEKATDSFVIYSVNNETIDADRNFIFVYRTNSAGKICFVREAELLDFIEGEEEW